MRFIKKIKVRGFTLVETLVAVLVLSTAIAGPLTIASKGLSSSLVSKDQITAFFLAQDAIEYVRYARDTNCLTAGSTFAVCPTGTWLVGTGGTATDLTPCIGAGNFCYIDTTNNSPSIPTTCTSAICPKLNYDSSAQLYTYAAINYTTIKPTGFTRTINLSQVDALGNEYKLTVSVYWVDQAGVSHPPVSVYEYLYNWE